MMAFRKGTKWPFDCMFMSGRKRVSESTDGVGGGGVGGPQMYEHIYRFTVSRGT